MDWLLPEKLLCKLVPLCLRDFWRKHIVADCLCVGTGGAFILWAVDPRISFQNMLCIKSFFEFNRTRGGMYCLLNGREKNCLRKSLELRVVDDGRLLGKHGLCRLLGMRLGADDRVRCLFRWGFDPHGYMIMIPILEKLGFLLEMLKSVCSTFGFCITTFWGCVVFI